MKTLTLTATPDAAGRRLDAWLSGQDIGLSRSGASRVIEQGLVTVDGKPGRKSLLLAGGERVDVTIPPPAPLKAAPQALGLDIVFEDEHLLVVNKPRGMVVHPAPGNTEGTLVSGLLAHCALSGVGGHIRPGIVHRLDKDTSGLLIAAKTDAAHLALASQLKSRALTRVYEGVARGNIKQDEGVVNLPIGRSPRDRKKMAVVAGGRPSVTEYRVLARANGYTYVRCKLQTGRTHQIRVHLAHLGHPLAGDSVYGGRGDKSGVSGQCLHARMLEFVHPHTLEKVALECPLPEYFTDALARLGLAGNEQL